MPSFGRLYALSLLFSPPSIAQDAATGSGRLESPLPDVSDSFFSFKSRPDIKPPKLDIRLHGSPDYLEPGFIFTSPYTQLRASPNDTSPALPDIGPHIYDSYGELVWSGAHIKAHQAKFNFRSIAMKDSMHLALSTMPGSGNVNDMNGSGYILDASYAVEKLLTVSAGDHRMDMHEFSFVDGGKNALIFTHGKNGKPVDLRLSGYKGRSKGYYCDDVGFQDVDHATGKVEFEWWALPHIHPTESYLYDHNMTVPHYWDWLHANSIDKDENGDYLFSARFASTVYKISGQTGEIMWRLGGKNSDFIFREGLSFSFQHDVRVLHTDSKTTRISIFNNAATEEIVLPGQRNYSTVQVISLDMESMTASLLQEFDHPDRRHILRRGNAQVELPITNNAFVSWGENGSFTEFAPNGEVIMEGRFATDSFVTYRAFKLPWKSETPSEPIAVFSERGEKNMTKVYASWNGATSVARWRFYASQSQQEFGADFRLVGTVPRTSFETVLAVDLPFTWFYAEAINSDGEVIGTSPIIMTPRAAFLDGGPDSTVASAGSLEAPTYPIRWLDGSSTLLHSGPFSILLTAVPLTVIWYLVKRHRRRRGIHFEVA